MVSLLRRLFGGGRGRQQGRPAASEDDLAWLAPPEDTQSPAAWDRYWNDQVSHGLNPLLFDLFCDDQLLIDVMRERGMDTVLCFGSGISQEPRALAEAGFQVTAVDFSPVALHLARTFPFEPSMLQHFFDPGSRRPGGRVDFVVADILDPAVCPGPYAVIIERRTIQNFSDEDRSRGLTALAERLTPDGIFLSHCHDGAWRPPAEPRHATEAWFRQNRWPIWRGPSDGMPQGRVAWIVMTTG